MTEALEATRLFARLLSDAALRRRFLESAEGLADELELTDELRRFLLTLPPDDLQRQAETLIRKRFYEVRHWIPDTISYLGNNALETFRAYAEDHWPQGHQRHRDDAVGFLQFLRVEGLPLSQCESNWLEFSISDRRWRFRWVVEQIPELVESAQRSSPTKTKRKRLLQIFWRKGRRPCGWEWSAPW